MTAGKPAIPGIQAGLIGYLTSPDSFRLPEGPEVIWALDNGCFSESPVAMVTNAYDQRPRKPHKPKNFNEAKWLRLMDELASARDNCLFVVAPDVFTDAQATIARALPYLDIIRAKGYSPALVAQDGVTIPMLPWDAFDCLFIGGTDPFRHAMGPALAREANNRGKWCHLGRVNSDLRLRWGEAIGCHSADGTIGTFSRHWPLIQSWAHGLRNQHPLFDLVGKHGGTP